MDPPAGGFSLHFTSYGCFNPIFARSTGWLRLFCLPFHTRPHSLLLVLLFAFRLLQPKTVLVPWPARPAQLSHPQARTFRACFPLFSFGAPIITVNRPWPGLAIALQPVVTFRVITED